MFIYFTIILSLVIILLLFMFIHFYAVTDYLLFTNPHPHTLELEYLDTNINISNLNIFEILIIYYFNIYFKNRQKTRVYCKQNGRIYYYVGYINQDSGVIIYKALTTQNLIIRV